MKTDRLAKFFDSGEPSDLPILLTTDEVGRILGRHRNSIGDLIRAGKLPAKMHGRTYYVSRDAVAHVPVRDDTPAPQVMKILSMAMSKAGISPEAIGEALGYYVEMRSCERAEQAIN